MKKKVVLCKRCVLNLESPFIESSEGLCSHCADFDEHRTTMERKVERLKGNFYGQISKQKGTGDYDCIVMVSGGKDSVTTLKKLKSYGTLRVLAYTLDNGFESQEALTNIKNACNILKIDWILDRPWYLRETIIAILKSKLPVSICRFCAPIMVNRTIKTANKLGIPFVITGWNKGQSDKEPSRLPLWSVDKKTLNKLLKSNEFMQNIGLGERENDLLLSSTGIVITSPWIYEENIPEENMAELTRSLRWTEPEHSYPLHSTNCLLNFLQVVLSRKYFGYTHYDCEQSSLINFGEQSKERSIRILDLDIDLEMVKEVFKRLELEPNDLGLTWEEIKKYSKFQGAR